MTMSVNEQYLLETYGPLLTLETTAKLLDRPQSGVKQSALKKDNPLSKAKRKVGRYKIPWKKPDYYYSTSQPITIQKAILAP
jgi:hypothetical protein